MRTGSVFPLAAVVLLVAHHASAAPSVPEALKRVQTARENLAKAVKQIEKDPPSAADLDVAHAAVGALKAAIDAGGELEANDLEYAKAVLSARKELRTQREYVDARRANIKVHEARRAIDASLAALGESVKRLDAKEPSPQDLDGARAAAQAVRKQATEAQPFAKHDPKFATYLSEVDATVGRHEQKVDDRWVQLSAAKHRAQVAETRKRLSASLAAASKEMSSEKFDAASKELTTLEKQLVEGKPLEAKDKGYKPEADRARVEVAEAKKRMEALVSQASVDKLKGEIEPAHEQLIGSRKLLRSGPVTEEQLAEAKTAITVVKKLVEKFQSQAERSKPFGTYLEGVKKNLAETEVALQRRSLDGAKRNVVQALRQVERRNATDESFQETKTALTVLEKTLEPINAKDPELAAHVGDARQLIKDANITLTRRRSEVDILRHRAKIDEARKAASEKVRQLYAATPSAPEVAETEASVKAVQTLLEEGAPFAKKDGDYKAHAKETQDRIADLNGRIASRKIQLAATDGRSKVSEALGEAEPKVETARGAESTDAQIEQAAKSVDAVGLALDSRAALEKQDSGYAAHAARAKTQLTRLQDSLATARKVRELRKQTVEALVAAVAAKETADDSRNLRVQRENYDKAVRHLKVCTGDGADMLKVESSLASVPVVLSGSKTTPKEVVAECETQLKAVEVPLQQVKSLIALEDGPKASYEKARSFQGQGKKTEANTQFMECIASGRVLAREHPELREHKVKVAGGTMSLDDIIKQCVQQRKLMAGK